MIVLMVVLFSFHFVIVVLFFSVSFSQFLFFSFYFSGLVLTFFFGLRYNVTAREFGFDMGQAGTICSRTSSVDRGTKCVPSSLKVTSGKA